MKRILLIAVVITLYVLHQDIWFWRTPYFWFRGTAYLPFGFIPIGLFYQACFSGAASLLMLLLVKVAWPGHLDEEIEERKHEEGGSQ